VFVCDAIATRQQQPGRGMRISPFYTNGRFKGLE
jgi:hypothetical protein